jgi:hypothetical protein
MQFGGASVIIGKPQITYTKLSVFKSQLEHTQDGHHMQLDFSGISCWRERNSFIYGNTEEERKKKKMAELDNSIRQLYSSAQKSSLLTRFSFIQQTYSPTLTVFYESKTSVD